MSTPCRFGDKEYTNWIKCSRALVLFKEGLHDFIKTEVTNFHAHIQQKIANIPCGSSAGSQCGYCTWKSIKYTGGQQGGWCINCQNNICDKWLSQILSEHNDPKNRSIHWKNADISKWPTDVYEVAKVYMPKGQDKTKNLPYDFDAPAVLSLLKNCAWFTKKIQTTSNLSDLIGFRNEVMHSADLRVTDIKMNNCIDKMIQLMSELNIHGDVCTELQKTKTEDIDINFRETEVQVLHNLVSSIKEEMDSLQNAQIQQMQDIEEVKDNTMETKGKVVSMETEIEGVKLEVEKTKTEDIDINFRGKEVRALHNLVSSIKEEMDSLQDAQTQQMQDIEEVMDNTMEIEEKVASMETDIVGVTLEVEQLIEIYQTFKSFLANNPDIDDKNISKIVQAIEKSVTALESKFEKKHEETKQNRETERKITSMGIKISGVMKGIRRQFKETGEKHKVIETKITLLGRNVKGIKKEMKRKFTRKPNIQEGLRLSMGQKILKKTLFQQTALLPEKGDCHTFAKVTNSIHVTKSEEDMARLSHLSGELSALLKRYEKNQNISVWPGTDLEERRTVFVCLYQGDIQKTKTDFEGIDIYYIDAEKRSRLLEPPHKMPVKKELTLSYEDAKLLQEAIEEHGIDLFKQHTNLEAITGSSYILSKSEGYIKCPSVVLYCRVKGIAPIGENAFPKNLKVADETKLVRIDVREGYFTHGMYQGSTFCRTDWHDELRMGTSIGAEKNDQGTLGPFVKISNTDIGFVTCAHVILQDPKDQTALQQSVGIKVYQPADNESHSQNEKPRNERYCGDVSRIVFNPDICDPLNGLSKTVGVDAALVIVKGKRKADVRGFPFIPDKDLKNAGFQPSHPPAFGHGSVAQYPLNFREIQGKRVIKYGRTTGLTRGTLGLDGTMVKVSDSLLMLNHTKETVLMKGQYTVERTGKNPFFLAGDSGSGVFLLDERNTLTCIGLGIGYIHDFSDCYTVVTPIEYVLKALGLPSNSMQFQDDQAVQEMTHSRRSVDPAISPSLGIERSRRKRKANQTRSNPSSFNPPPKKKIKN